MAAYLIDTRSDRIGELMGKDGLNYLLRPVGGGRERTCPQDMTRIAEPAEKLSADVRALNDTSRRHAGAPPPGWPFPPDLQTDPHCTTCTQLQEQTTTAVDPSSTSDARVLLRRHYDAAHGQGAAR